MKKTKILARFLIWRLKNLTNKHFLLIVSAVVGILAGINALVLKTSVYYIRIYSLRWIEAIGDYNFLLLLYPSIGILLALILKKYIIKDSVKHNIASILYAISKRKSRMRSHKAYSSILGGVFTAGFGGSVGLESPIISAGAAIGSNISRRLNLDYKTTTLLLACGASGAIAAIFNTPIAAVVFALEVLLLDFTRFSLIPLLIASVSGAIVTKIFSNEAIVFQFKITESFVARDIPFYFLMAIFAGLISIYFSRSFLFIEDFFDKIKKTWTKFIIGSLAIGLLLFFFPPLYGEGFETIKSVFDGNLDSLFHGSLFESTEYSWLIIALFLVALVFVKVWATAITIGGGGVGGIVAPSLFTGALAGFLFAFLINNLFGLELSLKNFALVGMGSVLAGVLNAPLTGIFLIAELTWGYELIVPLMLSTTISFVTVKSLDDNPIITKQLAARGELITHHKDKAVLSFMKLTEIIETDLKTISIDAYLGDLVKVVAKSSRNIFPVIDAENNFIGIVLLDDVREIMFEPENYSTTKVEELMTMPPDLILKTDTMDEIMEKFKISEAWNLPVVDENKYVGFVSKSKMFSIYRQQLVDISEE